MSQSGRNSRGKKGERFDLELAHVVLFLRFLAIMTGALFIVSLGAFLLTERAPASDTVYGMTILINFAAAFGSLLGAWRLNKKDIWLSEQEMNRKIIPPKEESPAQPEADTPVE